MIATYSNICANLRNLWLNYSFCLGADQLRMRAFLPELMLPIVFVRTLREAEPLQIGQRAALLQQEICVICGFQVVRSGSALGAESLRMHSHAERGNEKSQANPKSSPCIKVSSVGRPGSGCASG